MNRKIDKILTSKPTVEGAGVHLKRAFGYYEAPELDPFCFLTISAPMIRKTISPDSPGILIEALKL